MKHVFAFIVFCSVLLNCDKHKTNHEMVLIKGGTFLMGQEDGEGDEKPVHEVSLDDFFIGKFEITVAEYKEFCDETNRNMPKEPSFGWNDNHPIVNTSWFDAVAYIDWLNDKLGESYRLPTEAEFEYVIRNGGEAGIYPWGTDQPKNENIADETLAKEKSGRRFWQKYDDGYVNSSPVGAFPANKLGVHDINGNAWEWCSDWYDDYPSEAQKNPQGPDTGTHKVGRGASFDADPWHCRSAGRSWVNPTFTGPGFRLAKDAN